MGQTKIYAVFLDSKGIYWYDVCGFYNVKLVNNLFFNLPNETDFYKFGL